jgi:transposase
MYLSSMSELQADREKAVHLRRLGCTTAEVAAELSRSPQWVRKCWRRYQSRGWAGLAESSRVPHQHGRRLSPEIQQMVRRARTELEAEAARGQGLKYIGGRAIRTRLKQWNLQPLPSVRTIERIVEAAQMTRLKETKPVVEYPRLNPSQAHQLCQIDHAPLFTRWTKRSFVSTPLMWCPAIRLDRSMSTAEQRCPDVSDPRLADDWPAPVHSGRQ